MMKPKYLFLLLLISITGIQAFAQNEVNLEMLPKEYRPYIFADEGDLKWFTDARFGVFIHWGPSSLAEVPISWGRFGPRPGAGRQATSGVPREEYDNLYKVFNPEKFDADEWVGMMKDAGAGYMIFTTKHHDGFCMFDASNTDYKITNTPFGRDVAKELSSACHKHGIKIIWYYSQPDWHHPDCLTENNANYRDYMYQHLRELLTNYGEISGIFFDGLGSTSEDWDTPGMLKMIRTLQPGIVVNRRWGSKMPGIPENKKGDYDTPEQEIGRFQVDRPWESCATMSTAWSWTGGSKVKSFKANLRLLIQCAGSGGNLALNTGPMPDGSINNPEEKNYLDIGKWLEKYGESIYGTRGGPYMPGPWGVSTNRGNKIYLHILTEFTEEAEQVIELPAFGNKINKAYTLTGGEVDVKKTSKKIVIRFTDQDINKLDNIVVLELDGNADQIEPIETLLAEEMVMGKAVASASSYSNKNKSPETIIKSNEEFFAEGKRHRSWWEPGKNDEEPWLSVTFPDECTFNYMTITEQIRNATTRKFELDYWDREKWVTFYKGSQIGFDFALKTQPLTSSKLRIRLIENQENSRPNISTFKVYKTGL